MSTKAEVLKRIKLQCQECMGSTVARKGETSIEAGNLVLDCTAPECSLFPFRMGKDPWPTRKGNPGSMEKARSSRSVPTRKAQISTISPEPIPGRGTNKNKEGKTFLEVFSELDNE